MSKVIDAALKEISNLKQEVSDLENEKVRLNGELRRLAGEIGDLEKKKSGLKEILGKKEKELLDGISIKEKEVDRKLAEVNNKITDANDLIQKANDDKKETDKVKAQAQTELSMAKTLDVANSRISHELKELVSLINTKLGKL